MKGVLLAIAGLVAAVMSAPVLAQQDTTAPELLDFTIAPLTFDTGAASVTLQVCGTARDDLSGLDVLQVTAQNVEGGLFNVGVSFPSGAMMDTLCAQFSVPRFVRYGTFFLAVQVYDAIGNVRSYAHPLFLPPPNAFPDLCSIGACEVVNRASVGLSDIDGDGVPDDADNCPDVSNADQADRDIDGVGDACDPFPNDRDNEQAQCEADLAACQTGALSQCLSDLAQATTSLGQCAADLTATTATLAATLATMATITNDLAQCRADLVAENADADGDGAPDVFDRCPGTLSGESVDDAGCSQVQFCGRIDATTREGTRACRKADWKNDEPLMRTRLEADCVVDWNTRSGDEWCVPATP